MKNKNRVVTVRLTDDLFDLAKSISKETSTTISCIVRGAFARFSRTESIILKAEKALKKRSLENMQLIHFPCQKSKVRLFVHKSAFSDMLNMSKESSCENEIMDFFSKNIDDEDIVKLGDFHNEGDNKYVIFDIGTIKAVCLVGAYTLTLLAVC